MARTPTAPKGAGLPLEKSLWMMADKLRKGLDAASYKHVVLGLIFLKHISDGFEEVRARLAAQAASGADPEDRDEYKAEGVFFVPPAARWSHLHGRSKQPDIGTLIDEAMEAIEKENPTLRGVLPAGTYAQTALDKAALGQLLDVVSNIALGDEAAKSKDILGRVYEYFLGEFANEEGKKGGQFYTPDSIVRLMVELIQPFRGRVYDPCCGSGGMFVMSEKLVDEHKGRIGDISVYGQESNHTTYKLCRMNLAIRGIDGSQVKWNSEGSFLNDAHPDLKADFILANPPFNVSDWGQELLANDPRWQYGLPPGGNANFGWVQHMIWHLAPTGSMALVLANGSLSSNSGGEGEIRQKLVEAGLVDAIVALPKQLFYNTGIPACIWLISRKRDIAPRREVLFIDAGELGYMADRTHRKFGDGKDGKPNDIKRVADTFHAWKSGKGYADEKGYCKAAKLDEVAKHGFVLTPGRYVGIPDAIDDGVPFEEKMAKLTAELSAQMAEGRRLDEEIKKQLGKLGFNIQ